MRSQQTIQLRPRKPHLGQPLLKTKLLKGSSTMRLPRASKSWRTKNSHAPKPSGRRSCVASALDTRGWAFVPGARPLRASVDHVRGQPLGQHGDEIGPANAECRVPARRVRHLDRRDRGPVLRKYRESGPTLAPHFSTEEPSPPAAVGGRCSGSGTPGADFAKAEACS